MLNVYGTANGCLTEFPADPAGLPPDAVWIDLVEPTANEESKVEGVLGGTVTEAGDMALVVDVPGLVRAALAESALARSSPVAVAGHEQPPFSREASHGARPHRG